MSRGVEKKSAIIFSRLCCDSCIVCVIAHIQSCRERSTLFGTAQEVLRTHTKNYLLRDHMRVIIPLFNNSHMSGVVVLNMALMCSRVCIGCFGGGGTTTLLSHCYLYHKEWDSSPSYLCFCGVSMYFLYAAYN